MSTSADRGADVAPVGERARRTEASHRDATVGGATRATASRTPLLLAFATVYIVWGSTYLAIRYAIATIPPFVMASSRFLVSGAVLYSLARWQGAERPTRPQWRSTAIIGALLLVGGNGAVVWGEQRVPSGLTALLIAVGPLFTVAIDWLRPGGVRPARWTFVGVLLGLIGLAILVGPGRFAGHGGAEPLGATVIMAGALAWALGSIYSRHAPLPASAILSTGMQMLVGGLLFGALAMASGELHGFDIGRISVVSWIGFAYLATLGSIVAYTVYTWLLQHASPAHVSTYAYVNPVVAVFLGWAIAGEAVTGRVVVAAAVIIGAVGLITATRKS